MRVTTFVLPVLIAATASAGADRRLVEGIVVRVNDRILTTSDIRQRAAESQAQTGKPVTPDQYPQFIQEAADELCMLERAEELKLEVSSEELNSAIQDLKEQNHVQDDASFEAALRETGMTLDMLRSRIHDSILVNRLLRKEVGDLPITEEELRQRYEREKGQFTIGERVHLEHIVFSVTSDPGDADAKLAAARRLVAAARSGDEFKKLVQREVDAGHGTGGDLGTVFTTDMRSEVRDAVAKLKPGEISDPFTTSAGVHVVRLVERIPPTAKPFAEVEDELRERELAERYRSHLASVVTELKKRYIVEVHPELMAAAK
ncbi:MAG TPA: peptidyl-prolyl cis-trans isomerase [Thermoanaerobaculaceae bacterium]|nr:peptidyl-prolyl cis-trans isomerase [Thermoanaerobaculaceae bacterium]